MTRWLASDTETVTKVSFGKDSRRYLTDGGFRLPGLSGNNNRKQRSVYYEQPTSRCNLEELRRVEMSRIVHTRTHTVHVYRLLDHALSTEVQVVHRLLSASTCSMLRIAESATL